MWHTAAGHGNGTILNAVLELHENKVSLCFPSFPLLFPAPLFFIRLETAVNIGYSCKLLDPDTRLLEWQELRLAMIKIHRDTHAHTYTISLIFVCLVLQTDTPVARPGGQFLQGQTDGAVGCRQGKGWSKDCCGPHWTWAGKHWTHRKYVTHLVFKWPNSCHHIVYTWLCIIEQRVVIMRERDRMWRVEIRWSTSVYAVTGCWLVKYDFFRHEPVFLKLALSEDFIPGWFGDTCSY